MTKLEKMLLNVMIIYQLYDFFLRNTFASFSAEEPISALRH